MKKPPFIAGLPVTGELFVDREEEIKKLIALIKARQPTAISSPRKIGKTSLIKEVENRLKNIIPIYIDCWELTSQKELAENIIKNTIKAYSLATGKKEVITKVKLFFSQKIRQMLDAIESIDGEIKNILTIYVEFKDRTVNIKELLTAAFDFPDRFAREKKIKFVLIFDEFQNLKEFDGELLKLMRARIQQHKAVSYVISGSQQSVLEYLLIHPSSPFYKMFEFIKLEMLHEQEVKAFIKKRFKKFGFQIGSQQVMHICYLTACHPFYFQKLCLKIYNMMSIRRLKAIDEKVIKDAYESMIEDLWPTFEDTWSVSLSKAPLQKEVLKLLAFYDFSSAKQISDTEPFITVQSANLALRELVTKGFLIKKARGEYEFIDKIFKDFIKRRFG